ncbi:MAG: transketolase [Spirochaetaceae bacterium]
MASVGKLEKIARQVRRDLLQTIHIAGGGHTGGSLSSVDILVALFFHAMRYSASEREPDRDRFILSKGHSVEGYYAVLAEAGFFPREELESYGTFNSRLFGHPTMKVPGVEVPTGALGHGLSVGVGMAIAGDRDGRDYRVFVLMGDGEQAEGSVWEAAMAASHYRLGNLIAIIDYNKLQISGSVDEVMKISSLHDRWKSFGWNVTEVEGNEMGSLVACFDRYQRGEKRDAPSLIVAHTTKGKGVSFMENAAGWHHRVPTDEELSQAIAELNGQQEVVE